MTLTRVVLSFAVLLGTFPAFSADIYIPAAAHEEGVNGTHWVTDVEIRAIEDATLNIEFFFRDQSNPQPQDLVYFLPGGTTQRLEDIVLETFGLHGAGAVRITETSGTVVVTSRTYNQTEDGTFGQFIPGMSSEHAGSFGHPVTMMQLSRSNDIETGFRTNLGLLNTSDTTTTVHITVFAAPGRELGSFDETLTPFESVQLTDVFGRVTNDTIADGFITCTTSSPGATFLAYASVVDNVTGDAYFVPGTLDPLVKDPTEDAMLVEITSYDPEVFLSEHIDLTISDMSVQGQIAQDILITRMIVTPARTDGGTVASPVRTIDVNVFVPARGLAQLTNWRAFPFQLMAEAAPLIYLDPMIAGSDPETEADSIRQNFELVFEGITADGLPVRSQPIDIAYTFRW